MLNCEKTGKKCGDHELRNSPECKAGSGGRPSGARGQNTWPLLGRWLRPLSWVMVPYTVVNIMVVVGESFIPILCRQGLFWGVPFAVAYGLLLIKLTAADSRYRVAGICTIISGVGNIWTAELVVSPDTARWAYLFTILTSVVTLLGLHRECYAHAEALTEVDRGLSARWRKLWGWCVGIFAVTPGIIVLFWTVPFLGLLTGVIICIGGIVVSILRLVYLWRTAKRFRKPPFDTE
ncbi:MAG: hypothetical protein Q4D50_09675 [Eubacteriales bacterium]|nr:hypothetical protein [Eubacteriales bacterium]